MAAISLRAIQKRRAECRAGDPDGRLFGGEGWALRGHRVLVDRRPGFGDFDDAVILKAVGEVDIGLLSA